MEKTYSCERHGNTVFVAAVNYYVVTYGAARFNYIRNTASSCTLYVVVKREECVRTERYIVKLCEPCLFLFFGEWLGTGLKCVLPNVVAY